MRVLTLIKQRASSDIFGMPILSFLFKNKYMLAFYRLLTLFLLIYAIAYGFINPTKENIFTNAVFWSIFWPFFMVISLPTLGNVFCMVCPHGFLGKHITKIGLKRRPPKWLANPYIGLIGSNILAYWFVMYTFPGFLRSPLATASFFLFFTLLSMFFFFLFRGMAYCKYICPIGSVNTAFSRTSFTWLSTYQEECKGCKKPECALACPYELNPSKFEEKKSMFGCTLCMECAHACQAVRFDIKGWGYSLYQNIKNPKVIEVMVYVLLVAVITFTMRFHHGLSRSALSEYMPWVVVGKALQSSLGLPRFVDMVGLVAMLMALALVLSIVYITFKAIAKALKKDFWQVFTALGYAFAPLMIVGGLSHVLEFFFIEYYHNMVNGFSQAFGLGIKVEPLAKRGEAWLLIFRIFPFIAGFWSMHILWKRVGMLTEERKAFVFGLASLLPLVYILLSLFTLIAMLFFPAHHHHG
ncbi:MAG: 4Fe-4S binding protein, partial [Aquificaceae bacterium]